MNNDARDDVRADFCDEITLAVGYALRNGVTEDEIRADFEAVLSIQDHTPLTPRPAEAVADGRGGWVGFAGKPGHVGFVPGSEGQQHRPDTELKAFTSEPPPVVWKSAGVSHLEADSGIVNNEELDRITRNHLQGRWLRHEMHLSRWEV